MQETQKREARTARPKRAELMRKKNRMLGLIRGVMLIVGALSLLIGLVLLILPTFRVGEIVVSGNTMTSTEEIIAASGVQVGDEVVGINLQTVANQIQSKCPVRVKVKLLPNKLEITVTERETLYIEYGDQYFSLSEDLEVLAVSDSAEEFGGLILAKLPPIEKLSIGQKVVFCNQTVDRSYITDMLGWLEERSLSDRVRLLDVSEKYHVSYVLDGTHQIVVGSVSELAVKQRLAEEILELREGSASCAVVDVSDLKRSTYRPVERIELFVAE